jgi:hypothetical protein
MNKNIWDEIAQEQARIRTVAGSVRKLKDLVVLPPEELVELFIALCQAGPEYDPKCLFRRFILRRLPDTALVELLALRMSTKLTCLIEKRLRPAPPEADKASYSCEKDD